jgi:hypothetical protein
LMAADLFLFLLRRAATGKGGCHGCTYKRIRWSRRSKNLQQCTLCKCGGKIRGKNRTDIR